MEALFALIGAVVGAVTTAAVTVFLFLRKERAERQAAQERMSTASIDTLSDTISLLHDLEPFLGETRQELTDEDIDSLDEEWGTVRKQLVVLRQLHPSVEVRHDAERLWQSIDACLDDLFYPDPGDSELSVATRKLDDAQAAVDDLTRLLRAQRSQLDKSYQQSRRSPA
jgi:hypothetical protein